MKNACRLLAWFFALLAVILVVGSLVYILRYLQVERQVRYENEYIYAIWNLRDAAFKSDKAEAAKILFDLQDQPFRQTTPVHLLAHMEILVAEERKRAIKEIIGDFRTRTGKDLGEKPGPWILMYGYEDYKQLERQIENPSQ